MPPTTLTVYEGSLRGRAVGTYHHNGMNGLYAPRRGEIIRLNGADWRIIEGVALWSDNKTGTLIVEQA